MKYYYFCIFLIVVSCTTVKKTYMCGNHICLDKKEFNEYFAENLTIEVKILKKKKKSINLVQLNSLNATTPLKITDASRLNAIKKKKKNKADLKTQRSILKQKRKNKKIEEKNNIKNKKYLAKLKQKNDKENIAQKTIIDKKLNSSKVKTKNILKSGSGIDKTKVSDKILTYKSVKTKPQENLCKEINDCDIDKIAELLLKKGSKKKYPDITSK
jgi:hypothetical protein